jgi:hypothetical protein
MVLEPAMSRISMAWLCASGALCVAGALLHLAIPFGGPAWYSFAGAPQGLVAMAEAGRARPIVSCVVIACLLLVFAAYAFSALGLLRRLPATRVVLGVVGVGLVVRGLWFPVLALRDPAALGRLCGRCGGLNAFVVATSALCLFIAVGFLLGARVANERRRRGGSLS